MVESRDNEGVSLIWLPRVAESLDYHLDLFESIWNKRFALNNILYDKRAGRGTVDHIDHGLVNNHTIDSHDHFLDHSRVRGNLGRVDYQHSATNLNSVFGCKFNFIF